MSIVKNLKQAVAFGILKVKEENLFALEDLSHVTYALDEYNKDKSLKTVKGLDKLTSISLAKAYYYLFTVNHKACDCWRCQIREECLRILIEQKINLIVLGTLDKVIKMPENIYPFFEEWIIKREQ